MKLFFNWKNTKVVDFLALRLIHLKIKEHVHVVCVLLIPHYLGLCVRKSTADLCLCVGI